MSAWLEALLGKILNSGVQIPLSKGLNFTGGAVATRNPATNIIDVTVPYAPTPGTLDRQVPSWDNDAGTYGPERIGNLVPGAPVYDVRDFGPVGTNDDTATINAAIAAANASPGVIRTYGWHRIRSPLTTITGNNITFQGNGDFNGGTILLVHNDTFSGPVLTITGQLCTIANVWIAAQYARTDSIGIRVRGFRPLVHNVLATTFGIPFEIDFANTASLVRCRAEDILGVAGFNVHGNAPGDYCHNTQFDQCQAAQAYPLSLGTARGDWATSTAYTVGQVVRANGMLWQCSTSGTSAGSGSGPSGLPSTNPNTIHTVTVADGTAAWRFAMSAFDGFRHGSFAHTVMYNKCGVLQGYRGMHAFDDAGAAPTFIHAWQFSADHTFSSGVSIEACAGAVMLDQTLAISTLLANTPGIDIGASATRWQISGGETLAAIKIAGTEGIVRGVHASQVQLDPTADGIVVGGCNFTATPGITIASGADDFVIEGNVARGGITDGAGPAVTRRITNNVGIVNTIPYRIGITTAGARDTTKSSANTTVTAAGSGQYDITFPPCTAGLIHAQFVDGTTAGSNVMCIVEAPNYAAGTASIQLNSGANLAGGDTIDITIWPQ